MIKYISVNPSLNLLIRIFSIPMKLVTHGPLLNPTFLPCPLMPIAILNCAFILFLPFIKNSFHRSYWNIQMYLVIPLCVCFRIGKKKVLTPMYEKYLLVCLSSPKCKYPKIRNYVLFALSSQYLAE